MSHNVKHPSWIATMLGHRPQRRRMRPFYREIGFEPLEYRTLLSAEGALVASFAPEIHQAPVVALQSSAGAVNAADPGPASASGPVAGANATPGTTAPAATPTGNPNTPALKEAVGKQSVPAAIAVVDSSLAAANSSTSANVNGASSTTNPNNLSVSSNVNAGGISAADSAIGNARYPWSGNSKGGSNAAGDPSGTGDVDQFWSAASQQIVTGVILDMWI